MPLLCVICQSDVPHDEHQDDYVAVILKFESLTGRIKYKEHRFDLRDK